MKLQRPKLVPSIDADLAMGVIGRNFEALTDVKAPIQTSVVFNGVYERTAKGDELTLSVSSTSKRNIIRYQLKRDSIYHILPEYLFHPLDRYADCDGDKTLFLEKRAAQKKTESEAKEYFYPFDKSLNNLRIKFQNHLNESVLGNESFIIDFITENNDVNKANLFIKACLPYIIHLRADRGSAALVMLALKMTFGQQLAEINRHFVEQAIDIDSESCHITLDGIIDDLFCGNHLIDWNEIITVKYQTVITSSEEIRETAEMLDEFSYFFKRWFLSENQRIEISFGDFKKPPVITDNTAEGFLFLNYNTQLLAS